MAKIIVVCNQKGGVGKTTTAINLSTFLALEKKKILLVDLDPQGNTTSGLGIDKTNLQKTSYDLLIGKAEAVEVITLTAVENLSLVPSNTDLIGAEVELVSEIGREFKLKDALDRLSGQYDYIFIDSPPSLGLLTLNALCASSSLIIPLQCEYYALEGLGQLMTTIQMVQKSINRSLQIEGIVMTMADFRTNLTQEVIKEVKEFLPGKVYESVIPRSVKLSEAPSFGKPIWFHDKHSQGSIKYKELAIEFLKKNEPCDTKSAREQLTEKTQAQKVLGNETIVPHETSSLEQSAETSINQEIKAPSQNIVSRETDSVFRIPPEGVINSHN
ncbi:MAG: ParA family protein [Candidatus Omnitrophica bacterium]|nr:ParA family protein [Candidatus Omnitrophota bacterium]